MFPSLLSRCPIFPLLPLFVLIFCAGECDGRLVLPQLGVREWRSHDLALKSQLAPLHSCLASDVISPSEAARDFSTLLADFLGGIDVFKGGEGGGREKTR